MGTSTRDLWTVFLRMKAFFLLGFLLTVVGFSQSSLLGAKLGLLKGKILGLEKAYVKKLSKVPLLGLLAGGGAPTTTPAPTLASTYPPTHPPTLKCDVIWEEKVTPLCQTVHEKICKTDTKDHCHKIWEDKCWDEPVEHCTPKEECNHVLENVCKTEYTVTCDDEHGGHGTEAADEEYGTASEPEHVRHRRAVEHHPALKLAGKKIGAKIGPILGLKKAGKILGVGAQQTTAAPTTLPPTHKPRPPHEELCHHHPHTTCWDEPVEKCETIQECIKDVKNLCKKVPKEVCEPVSVENCWDEPSEKCEYMMVKVARKHCRDPHKKDNHAEPEH